MSWGEIAGLIAALAFLLLVIFMAVPLVKLGKMFDGLSDSIDEMTKTTIPLIEESTKTIQTTNEEFEKISKITSNVQKVTENVAALSDLYSSVLAKPILKVKSFSQALKNRFSEKKKGFEYSTKHPAGSADRADKKSDKRAQN